MTGEGVRAYVGLGSNLGDRLANLQAAVDGLARRERITVVRTSRVYETEPVGGPPQPDYLNAVVEVTTTLSPRKLLDACLAVEQEMGRVRAERWGPRIIDLDVLTYDREEVDDPGIRIPHPRMQERGFVLAPLLELDPDPLLPDGRHIASLRSSLAILAGVRPFAPALRLQPDG